MKRIAHSTGLDHDGVDELLLQSKQDTLKVNGQPINTTVLDTFVIGGAEENNATNSLVTAAALENWFEGIQTSFLTVLPGQNSGHRVGTIDSASPSTTNVPSCSAVVSLVNTKLLPINSNITNLQNDKVNQSQITNSINPLVSAAGSLIPTESAYLNNLTVGGVTYLTVNADAAKLPQHALFGASVSELTDPSFQFIEARVHDVSYGFNASMDFRLATMACTHNHITSQISASTVSPTFTGTVTLPNPSSVILDFGIFTSTLAVHLDNVIEEHVFTSIDLSTIVLANTSALQSPVTLNGLGVLNIAENAYLPVFCSNVYIGGDSSSTGTTITSLLQNKIDKPDPFFVWPSGVTESELGYLSNVTSDIQQQIDDKIDKPDASFVWPSSVSAIELGYLSNVTSDIQQQIDDISTQGFDPLRLGDNDSQSYQLHTLLYSTSFLPNSNQFSNSVFSFPGLGVSNAESDAYLPIFCSELYTGGGDTSRGTTLTQHLANKHPLTPVDTTPTLNSNNLITSGGVFDRLNVLTGQFSTSIAGKHPLTPFDSVATTGSTNFVNSGVVCDLFNDQVVSRTQQTMYPSYLYTQLGTAQIEVWYGWSSSVSSFADVISHISINSTNFYKFGADPGTGNFSYYTNYVPSIIFFENNSNLTLQNLNVSDKFMVRWSWVSYAPYTGSYTFRVGSDDGSRLQIRDSTLPFDSAVTVCLMDTTQAYITTVGAFTMIAGRAYEFQLFWFESSGGQRCTLEWQRPGDSGFSVFSPTAPCPDFNYYQPQFSVVKTGTGSYLIGFGETCRPTSTNYTISLTIESITTGGAIGSHLDDYMIAYHSKTTSSFSVYVKEQDDSTNDGTFRDVRFDFMCVSRGRIFCHGSVDGFTGAADVEYNYG